MSALNKVFHCWIDSGILRWWNLKTNLHYRILTIQWLMVEIIIKIANFIKKKVKFFPFDLPKFDLWSHQETGRPLYGELYAEKLLKQIWKNIVSRKTYWKIVIDYGYTLKGCYSKTILDINLFFCTLFLKEKLIENWNQKNFENFNIILF